MTTNYKLQMGFASEVKPKQRALCGFTFVLFSKKLHFGTSSSKKFPKVH